MLDTIKRTKRRILGKIRLFLVNDVKLFNIYE